jgi:Phospholipase_D-nuclease N-terminal
MLKALVIIVPVVLAIYCLVQVAQARADLVRTLPRWAWAVLIVLFPLLGAVGWLLLGRPRRPGPTRPTRGRIVAPDDDPDFLRRIRDRRRSEGPDEQR